MNDFSEHIAALSPKKRALLLRLLEKNAGELNSFPLSFAQQRLWFLDQWKTNRSLYNIPTAMRLKGLLRSALLEQALNEIVQRHEVLRTTFSSVEGQPIQIIAQALDLKLVEIDVNEVPWFRREAEIRRLMNAEAEFPFDLARGPLIRVKLLWIADREHVLLLTMHHIVSDGWSLEIFYRELSELYNAYLGGKVSPLPALSIQYVDYTIWQRNWLRGKVLEEHLHYWKQQLRGAPALLELPINRPRPAVQTFHGAKHPLILAKELVEALKVLSQREEVTLFMTMLAAFQTLLFRYTGQDDLVIGTPIANRTQTETEHVIGFFVNTLVLRTNLASGRLSFRSLLGRVREVALGAYAHQDLPFERLVEELQITRDLSYSPLFQVAFGLQSGSKTTLELAGITVQPLEIGNGTTKFDLTLSMIDTKDGLHGALEYNTDLFDDTAIGRMAEHYRVLLEGIVSNPEQSLANLPILSKTEQERLLFAWNNTSVEYPHSLCFHQIFEAQAERSPHALAMVMEDEQFTYEALNRLANQTAWYLQSLGVGPEVLVGIRMQRSAALVIGLLGVLKAGGAYVPLDPSYPAERSTFILHDAQVQVLLTHASLLGHLPTITGMQVVCLETLGPLIARQPHTPPPCALHPENLAYVIYTSGSTGLPKGTLLAHRGLSNLVLAQAHALPLSCESRVLQFASISFDASIWEIVMALSRGALLAVASQQVVSAGHNLLCWLNEQAISVVTLPPSVLHALPTAALPQLHSVIAAGEALPPTVVARWSEEHHLFNAYGPTETTVCASIAACGPQSLQRVTIGRPIANMQLYLLDAALQLVPVGVAGELYIGGEGLARGYLQRPELTADRFRPHPFSQQAGERLYKTGDRARYLADGSLEFLGRLDFQVKVRGFRIELEEIEAVLGQYPAICENIVLIREDVPGEKQLVAYITLHPQRTPTISDLRTYLKAKLPSYMIPSAFVTLERLPLTPNGKVDRQALPAPGSMHLGLETAYIAPRTPVEQTIAQIWQEVLHVEQVGIHDNFFDLGGHSLLLARIHSKLQVAFQREIPIINLFKYPTVGTLTDYFSQEQTEATSAQHSTHRTDTYRGSMQRQRQIRLKHHGEKEKRGRQSE